MLSMTSTTHPAHRSEIVIRLADESDHDRLARLATLDSAAPLNGPAIYAEVGGCAKAAIDLKSGRTIADPFTPTAELVDLLEVRAARLARAHAA